MAHVIHVGNHGHANNFGQEARDDELAHAGKGFMHESFHKDNPRDYTCDWFAWAYTLFGELIIKLHNERAELLAQAY